LLCTLAFAIVTPSINTTEQQMEIDFWELAARDIPALVVAVLLMFVLFA
jgi:hypothetical protein